MQRDAPGPSHRRPDPAGVPLQRSLRLSPRLSLRPGLRAVLREPGVLQVGLDAPQRALLTDCPDVRRLLDALDTGAPLGTTSPDAATALGRLERAGLVVDAEASTVGVGSTGRGHRAALARDGDGATAASTDRGTCRPLLEAPPALRPELVRLTRLAGLGEPAPLGAATVALLVVEGEYSRSRVDGWVRDGIPHLCVQAHDGVVTLGPYVVPGVTACRRCVDAHLGEDDPRRPIIVEQLARRPVAEPVDDLLLGLALAWAVQDLATAAEGSRPSSWSTSIRIAPDLATDRRPWRRHAYCGCAWDQWPG